METGEGGKIQNNEEAHLVKLIRKNVSLIYVMYLLQTNHTKFLSADYKSSLVFLINTLYETYRTALVNSVYCIWKFLSLLKNYDLQAAIEKMQRGL